MDGRRKREGGRSGEGEEERGDYMVRNVGCKQDGVWTLVEAGKALGVFLVALLLIITASIPFLELLKAQSI